MAHITLRAYLDELESLIESEALDEVIGHCRHILQHFPKNVATYRILGRSLLEKTRYAEAGDVFQRVLSVYPSDFVAQLGMSNVSEEMGQIPPAVWHLERAFEQDSNNPALHDELKRLMEKRDGSAPERIQLTRGGLAQLYAKGRLYEQAVLELQGALAQLPERIDLELLLAKVYWDSEHPIESADVALRVLERLPNSVEANRIMAELWLRGGRPSDAAPFVNRLEQLDPFLAWEVVNSDGKPLPPNAFQLPRLDWDARAAAALTTDVPDWVNAIGNVFDSPESVSLSGGVNDWLAESTPAPAAPPKPAPQTSRPSMLKAKMEAAADETPDWFKEQNKSAANEVPDWFKDSAAEPAAAISDEEVPDWFKSDAPAEPEPSSPALASSSVDDWFSQEPESQQAQESGAVAASWLDDDMPSLDALTSAPDSDQMPSGFTDLLAGSGSSGAATPAAATADIPDWLTDNEPTEESGSALDAMSWLVTGPLPSLDEPSTQPASQSYTSQSSSLPDQFGDLGDLDNLFGESTPSAASPEPMSAVDDDDPLGWLQAVPVDTESSGTTQAAPVSNLADWLSESTTTDSTPAAEEDPLAWMGGTTDADMPATTQAAPVSDFGDWLNESTTTDSTPAAEEEDPLGWMRNAVTDSESADTADTNVAALGLEATRMSPLDWLSNTTQPDTEEAEADPLAWMRQGETSDSALDSLSEPVSSTASSDDVASDALNWMRSYDSDFKLEPEQPSIIETSLAQDLGIDLSALEQKSTPEPTASNDLDFGSFGSMQTTALPGNALDWLNQDDSDDGDEDADQWLSKFMPGSTPAASAASTASPAMPPSSQPSIELEDDWLASFESTSFQTPAAQEQSDSSSWLSSTESELVLDNADTSNTSDSWFSSLEQPASESSSTDDFFSALNAPASETTFETESAPSSSADDWSAGLELGDLTLESDTAEAAGDMPDWMRGMAPAAAQPAAEDEGSKNRFEELIKAASEREAQPHIETGVLDPGALPDWLSGVEENAEPATAAPVLNADDFDLGEIDFESFGSGTSTPVQQGETPDWLSGMEPAASGSGSATPASSLDDLDFGNLSAEPVEAGETPDWLSNMEPAASGSGSAVPSSSLDDLDFGSLDTSPDTVEAGETPNWLSSMAPVASGSNAASSSSLDDLDFGSLSAEPAQPAAISSDDSDWLSAIGSSETSGVEPAKAPATSLPPADMPTTFPEIDFSDLNNDGIPDIFQQGEAVEAQPADFSFKYDKVAQSSESVNTSGESGTSSFSFKRKQPAWMKKSGKGSTQSAQATQESAPKSTGDDFSDWLTSDAFGSDEADNSDPDWLK